MSTGGGHGPGGVDPDAASAAKAAKKADLLTRLDHTLTHLNDLKAQQNHTIADMLDLHAELGIAPPVDLTGSTSTASVFGMPIQQFTKATFNDASLVPSKFTGKRMGIDSINRWIEQFNKYSKFKEMDDSTKFEFFKLLMVDEAADWAASLEMDKDVDFEELFELFRDRFLLTDIQKWQQARSVWQRQQKSNESVDEYITWVKSRAKNLPEINDSQLVYIVISGLRSDIRTDVLKAKHDTIDEVKRTARISEIAARESNDSSTTMADLEKTISSLVDKVDQSLITSQRATAQSSAHSATSELFLERQERREQRQREQREKTPQRDNQSRDYRPQEFRPRDARPRYDNRSPTPDRHTTRQQNSYNNSRSDPSFRAHSQFRQSQRFTSDRRPFNGQQTFNGRSNYRSTQRMQSPRPDRRNFGSSSNNSCGNCGHSHAQGQCPAYGQTCYNCNKRGHFSRLCRARNSRNSQ
jgi:hypothetical protein